MEPKEREKTVKRVVFFGGKAAPGYFMAKLVIRLINSVGEVINKDKATSDYLKVSFCKQSSYNHRLYSFLIIVFLWLK
jgi:starch phosphorylase